MTLSKINAFSKDPPVVFFSCVTTHRHKMKLKPLKPLKGKEMESEELLYFPDITGH